MRDIRNVVICGAGMMGKGIAHILSSCEDLNITVYDMFHSAFESGLKETFRQLVEKKVLSESEVLERLSRVRFTTDLECSEIKTADLVIECVFERLDIKQNMFAQLEERCASDTIFCTNTSVISPTEISAKLTHKERLVGTHFWNPAFLIPLVEVVKSNFTSQEVADTVMKFLSKAGKKPVMCKKVVPGFIANRLQHALWREAIYIVEQGIADAATVDEAVRNSFGLRLPQLGPMENADMVGTDLTYDIHNYIFKYLCNDTTPSHLLSEKVKEGNLGFKTGLGFEEWTSDAIEKSKTDLNEYLIKMIYNV